MEERERARDGGGGADYPRKPPKFSTLERFLGIVGIIWNKI